jgi:hypothetical protein
MFISNSLITAAYNQLTSWMHATVVLSFKCYIFIGGQHTQLFFSDPININLMV